MIKTVVFDGDYERTISYLNGRVTRVADRSGTCADVHRLKPNGIGKSDVKTEEEESLENRTKSYLVCAKNKRYEEKGSSNIHEKDERITVMVEDSLVESMSLNMFWQVWQYDMSKLWPSFCYDVFVTFQYLFQQGECWNC